MELADMQDLGSCAAGRVGSSPTFRMYNPLKCSRDFLCVALCVAKKREIFVNLRILAESRLLFC